MRKFLVREFLTNYLNVGSFFGEAFGVADATVVGFFLDVDPFLVVVCVLL